MAKLPMKTIAKVLPRGNNRSPDRFHVQKLAREALQDIRIKHRWDAIGTWENETDKQARAKNSTFFVPKEFNNGGITRKATMARQQYLLLQGSK